jgi:peptide/nickel transport system substrate-binding protein
MRTRRVLGATIGALLLVTSLTTACTRDEGGGAARTTLRVGWSSEPDKMNPLTSWSTEAYEVLSLVYDNLLGYDENLKTENQLAESFEYSTDGLSITYHLRPDVTWHDGEPFTSADVKFTFELIKDGNLGAYAQWLTGMTGVETPDDQTVVVSFDAPQAFNPGLAIPIVPEHIWSAVPADELKKFPNGTPVGTGPYRLVEWKQGETVTLERNPDWWGDAPAAKRIVFVLYGNEDVMAQALRASEVDILTEVPPTIFDGLVGADNVNAISLPSFSFHHIGFNVDTDPASKGNPLLLDPVIRQALNDAIDRDQLVELALAGHGQPGSVLLPPAFGDWQYKVTAEEEMNANPEAAIALLEDAGYTDTDGDGVRESPDGAPLEFRLIAIESTTVDVRAAELFRDAASEVGIKLDLQTMDENTLGDIVYNLKDPDWDIFVWGWDSGVADPDYMLGIVLCSQIGGNNDVFYCDQGYDALYDQQATTVEEAARMPIVHQMQQMFYESGVYIVMWYQDKLQAYRTDTWEGWTETPGGIVFNFTRDNYLNATPVA